MKKFFIVFLVFAVSCVAVFAGGQQGGGALEAKPKPLELTIAATVAEDHPQCAMFYELKKEVEKRTEGRVILNVYPNMTLGSEIEQVEMTRVGTAFISIGTLSNLSVFRPEIAITGLPYMFHSFSDAENFLINSDWGKAFWVKLEKEHNLRYLTVQTAGTRCLSTRGINVKSPADLRGVKIRSMEPQVSQDTILALGGAPVPVAFNELYMALQTGVVQGEENPIPIIYSQKFYEVQDKIYHTDHQIQLAFVVMNPDLYNKMSSSDQKIFDQAAYDCLNVWYNKALAGYLKKAEDGITAGGSQIIPQSQLDMNAFYASADRIINEKYMTNPVFAEGINAVRKFCGY
jgi:tripartite ATP-independent transporter DctP family solute receptor